MHTELPDETLVALFRAVPQPATPDGLPNRVHRRLRCRRRARLAAAATVVSVLLALAVYWPHPSSAPGRPAPALRSGDVAMIAVPPVEDFELLARQEDALLRALEEESR